mmetsp:Transcript_12577/g.38417  ORF Transcript_12577/g.38417 Transcript_12577/m.38417 type:complete len:241 (-) Transcript_12577:530-1252(-)
MKHAQLGVLSNELLRRGLLRFQALPLHARLHAPQLFLGGGAPCPQRLLVSGLAGKQLVVRRSQILASLLLLLDESVFELAPYLTLTLLKLCCHHAQSGTRFLTRELGPQGTVLDRGRWGVSGGRIVRLVLRRRGGHNSAVRGRGGGWRRGRQLRTQSCACQSLEYGHFPPSSIGERIGTQTFALREDGAHAAAGRSAAAFAHHKVALSALLDNLDRAGWRCVVAALLVDGVQACPASGTH